MQNKYIDLHLHLDGSLTLDIVKKLADLQNISLPYTDDELIKKIQVLKDCHSLVEYLKCFVFPLTLLQTSKAISEAIYLVSENLKKQGLIYAEIRFAPQLHCNLGLTQEEVILAALDGLNRASLKCNLILCCMRGKTNNIENNETVRLAKKYLVADGGVVAIDLAGAESLFQTSKYRNLFKKARKLNIPFTIHAGEACGANEVRLALKYGASRIGHGVRSYENKKVIDELIARQIPLEMCPISNLQTHTVESIKDYPLLDYLNKGIKVTLNTDNTAVSNITIKEQFEYLRRKINLTEELELIILNNSIDAAFTTDKVKEDLRKIINN